MKCKKRLIVSLGAILILASLSWGQDSLNVTRLGRYDYWDYASDIAQEGVYVYLVNNADLRIMDVTAPEAPVEIGYCHLPNTSYSVAVNGHYAYVGVGGLGLYVVDVANPRQPQIVGNCFLPSYLTKDLILNYPYVFAANCSESLTSSSMCVVNVSNPAAPALITSLYIQGQALALSLSGSWLYLAGGEAGLQIFDVSNPVAPVLAGNYPAPNFIHDVAVNGSRAYVLDGMWEWTLAAKLMILDLTDPTIPRLLSSYDAFAQSTDIQVSGNYAYVANYDRPLRIIDVSNPLAPREVGLFVHDGEAGALHLERSQLYLAGHGLTILDVFNPPTPIMLSQYYPCLGAREVAVQGSYAYVVNYLRGLDVFDIADPVHPRWKGFCSSPGEPCKVAVAQPYVYLADGTGGMRIINASDPANPGEAGFFFSAPVSDVGLEYPLAYLACGSGGLEVVNVTNPSAPYSVGVVSTAWPYLVAVSGSYAYTVEAPSSSFHGLRIFSLSDPAHPEQVGSLDLPITITPNDLDVEGSNAYVVTPQAMYIINVTNPAAPTLVLNSGWYDYKSADAEGNLLYLAKPGYFYVLNVSNPANPVPVGYWIYDVNYGVAVVNSIAYVGQVYCLSIFDCSDCITINLALRPINPPLQIPAGGGSFSYNVTLTNRSSTTQTFELWTRVRLPNQSWLGPLLGPLALMLPGNASVARLRNQTVPASAPAGQYWYEARVGNYPDVVWDTSGFAFTKLGAGGNDEMRMTINEWLCSGELLPDEIGETGAMASEFMLLGASPNPFNPTAVLRYELRAASFVRLGAYDISGRLVASLVDGWREAGVHEMTFDGAALPSGIYIYRLTARIPSGSGTTPTTKSEKMILLK